MQFILKHTSLFLIVCAALAACTDEASSIFSPDNGKTPIELCVGGVDGIAQSSATRASASAIITDGTNKTMETFKTNATIFMVMMSEYDTEHVDFDDPDNPHKKKFTVSRGDVTANSTDVNFDDKNIKYWDDAHARSSMLSIWGFAQQGIPQGTGWLSGSFDVPNPSWDGTDPLTEYKPQTYSTATTRYEWVKDAGSKGAIYPCINVWKTSHLTDKTVQNQTSVLYQDLLFTNNIADNTAYSKRDGRLKFDFTNRKFPRADDVWEDGTTKKTQLKFYHAMSKITIHIKKGEGFTNSDPFAFASGTNVKISGMNTEGTFNIKEGEFQKINDSYDITKIYQWTTPATGDAYTLEALAIPNIHPFMLSHDGSDDKSRFVSGKKNLATDVMMEFTIDNNKYQITSGQLYDALHVGGNPANALVANATEKTNNGTYIPLEAGKNYVFTFTVGKQKINNITAQVADWENVTADNITPTNARIKLQLEERGTAQTSDVAFYKANDNKTTDGIDDDYTTWNWKTGYTNLNAIYSSTHWTTNYFWESNKDFYHFRALMPAATGVTTAAGDGDYATLTSGASYTDVRWGAPMKDDGNNETAGTFTWTYDPTTNGFDNAGHTQIYKAIGPTEDAVKLILFHMMSDLTFTIKTTDTSDKVELCHDNGAGADPRYTHTRLDLVGFYNGGKVLLGTGLVKTTGDASTVGSPVNVPFNSATDNTQYVPQVYKFGAVPQDLTAVKLYITTPDNNQYIVDLKDVKATTVNTNNIANPYQLADGKYTINRWYPGFKYNYSFTLKKTGITNLQATIVNWETVTADDETVQIK